MTENQVQPPAVPEENPGLFSQILNSLPRLFFMYMLMSYFFGNKSTPTAVQPTQVKVDGKEIPSLPHSCLFQKLQPIVSFSFFKF
jgi:hypothetical protein